LQVRQDAPAEARADVAKAVRLLGRGAAWPFATDDTTARNEAPALDRKALVEAVGSCSA
jgi:hypothetical protein